MKELHHAEKEPASKVLGEHDRHVCTCRPDPSAPPDTQRPSKPDSGARNKPDAVLCYRAHTTQQAHTAPPSQDCGQHTQTGQPADSSREGVL